MRIKNKKMAAFILSGVCFLTVISGCGGKGKSGATEGLPQGADEAAEGTDAVAQGNSADAGDGRYKPSELTIPSQDSYDYPYMGLKFSLPKSLRERMDRQEMAMINFEEATGDERALSYALISWKAMTEKQRDQEVQSGGNEFYDWADSLEPVGAIGAYQKDKAGMLDELTGCTQHKEIGKSQDGTYTFYLSTNPDADSAWQEEINSISYEITDVMPLQEYMQSEDGQEGEDAPASDGENVGEFTTQDINGETCTQEMFADYDLTMVNVFTTWCSPCVGEIPDLQKLYEEMEGKGVNVVGIVLDCLDSSGNMDAEVVKKAKVLAERTGAKYPFLVPDGGLLNGRLAGINAVPETFFVDKEGNIVGETYSGSHTLEEWKEIVEKVQEGVAQ